MKMGILYRSERKRIIRSQCDLIYKVEQVLLKCASPMTKTEFNKLVLEKTPAEEGESTTDGYWYRRLVNAEYFRDIAELVVK